jgi:hypothetical protein
MLSDGTVAARIRHRYTSDLRQLSNALTLSAAARIAVKGDLEGWIWRRAPSSRPSPNAITGQRRGDGQPRCIARNDGDRI